MKRQFLVFIVVLISAMDFAWAEEKSSLSFFDRVKSKMERIVVEAKDKAREVKREIVQWYNGFRVDENKAEKTEKTEVAQSPESIAPVVPSAPIEIPTAQPQDLKEVVKNMVIRTLSVTNKVLYHCPNLLKIFPISILATKKD